MKRRFAYLIVIVALFPIAYEFVPLQIGRGLLSFDITADLHFQGDIPNRLDYAVVMKRSQADVLVNLPEDGRWEDIESISEYQGEPVTATVRGGETFSPYGRILDRWHEECLVVIARWPDGRRVAKIVEIPDSRVTKHISVTLP